MFLGLQEVLIEKNLLYLLYCVRQTLAEMVSLLNRAFEPIFVSAGMLPYNLYRKFY